MHHLLLLKLRLIQLWLTRHTSGSCAIQGLLVGSNLGLVAEDASGQIVLLVKVRASYTMTVTCGRWHVTVGKNLLLAVLTVISWLMVSTVLEVGLF